MTGPSTSSEQRDVLLLGSGWTATFLLPLLRSKGLSFAQTRRPSSLTSTADDRQGGPDASIYPLAVDEAIDADRCAHLPRASLVVVIFPLHRAWVQRLVEAYERGTGCTPAWLALGSTGVWPSERAGVCTSDTPVDPSNERGAAEAGLLQLNDPPRRPVSVLNLAGLYGGQRNPANFGKRACDTREKLEKKTSLHLVHGKDVARVIEGMWDALHDDDGERKSQLWGRRWMVTDGQVYDWWQLLSTFRPPPIEQGSAWVEELMGQYSIKALPRPWPSGDGNSEQQAPYTLQRVMDGQSFWRTLGLEPSVGRCDDYSAAGGGAEFRPPNNNSSVL